jgi:hypothetical protein
VIGEIVGLQRAEFARAASLQGRILYVQIAIALVAIATVVRNDLVVYIAALATMTGGLVWARADYQYKESRAQAERARRATLLTDGLGGALSAAEVRDLKAHFSVTAEQGRLLEDASYYATHENPGPQRLAEMLEETAFWTFQLLRYSAKRFWLLFTAFLACGLLLLFGSIPFASTQQVLGGVRIACAMLVLLVSTDVLGRALAYSRASHTVDRICLRIKEIKPSGYPRCDLLMILCDYNSAVECAPMPAAGIYEKHRDQLNRLWNES